MDRTSVARVGSLQVVRKAGRLLLVSGPVLIDGVLGPAVDAEGSGMRGAVGEADLGAVVDHDTFGEVGGKASHAADNEDHFDMIARRR